MAKHAFLIIAHKDDLTFRTLIRMLDDERNDLYIHFDKRFPLDLEKNKPKKSSLFVIERRPVYWGGYSQIDTELRLLKAATESGPYEYYHLLSGQDLPIVSNKTIHSFFETNRGKEFLRFEGDFFPYGDRVEYSHLLGGAFLHNRSSMVAFKIDDSYVKMQKRIGLKRNAEMTFRKGSNWFSISDELARFTLAQAKVIKRMYKRSLCCDEVFLQTVVHNSPFANRLYHANYDNDCRSIQRLIDWDRGSPYVFRKSDFDMLKSCGLLFARKFDPSVDSEIIAMIESYVRDCSK